MEKLLQTILSYTHDLQCQKQLFLEQFPAGISFDTTPLRSREQNPFLDSLALSLIAGSVRYAVTALGKTAKQKQRCLDTHLTLHILFYTNIL